jgi:hypothetical protein
MGVAPWVTDLTHSRKARGTRAWSESEAGREDAEATASQDPRDMAKAPLLEVQFRVCLVANEPLQHLTTAPIPYPASHPSVG